MSEIEEIEKKWAGEISSFPYARGAKRDIQILLSKISRLQRIIKEMEANELKFPTLSEFSNVKDENEDLKAEVIRLQDKILELEERITHLTLDKLLLKSRVKDLEEGIEKHKVNRYPSLSKIPEDQIKKYGIFERVDQELYNLLKKGE